MRRARSSTRPLNRGEEHRFGLALSAGEYATVAVETQDIDVTVQISGTAETAERGFQDDTGTSGHVVAELVAGSNGTYTLAVRPSPGTAASGSYSIRVANRRQATDADRSMQDVHAARSAALPFQIDGKLAEASPLLERALTIAEGVRGPDDLQVAAVAAQLAEVYLLLPDRTKSDVSVPACAGHQGKGYRR